MASCSRSEYKSNDRPEKCDYQRATCTYTNYVYNMTQTCKIRRKGSATWRDMHDKPSFKIKGDDKFRFGDYECGKYCPPGKTVNAWETKKVTLQNQAQFDGEIDAYDLFRKFVIAPLAVQTSVKLYKGGVFEREDSYVMLETIDDSKFMEKWIGEVYALYEYDTMNDPNPKLERIGNDKSNTLSKQYINISEALSKCSLEDSDCEKDEIEKATENVLKMSSHLVSILNLNMSDFDQDNMVNYYAAGIATNHWDSVCHHPKGAANNGYVAYNGSKYFFIPTGTDYTFVCPEAMPSALASSPKCTSMKQCLQNESCTKMYQSAKKNVDGELTRTPMDDCNNWRRTIIVSTLVPFIMTLLLVFVACSQTKL